MGAWTFGEHRLTMRVALERQAQDGSLAKLAAGVAELLSAVVQSLAEPWQNKTAARDTVQQIMALDEHLAPYLGADDAAGTENLLRLRGWAIWCLNRLGDSFSQAVEYGRLLVADAERVLGDTHPQTLTSRSNLAVAYDDAGRLDEAIRLYERTLADAERVLGDDQPQTLTSRSNLAYAYHMAGRQDEAIALFERTLAERERILGDTHPDTLTSRGNLAVAYDDAGRLDEAISLAERTLADAERVLGDIPPLTLTSRNNLAYAYRAAGRLDEAIPLYERTLADRERILGDTHPDTLGSRNNLACAYLAAGRLDEAIPLFERTLADRERVLGDTHSDGMRAGNHREDHSAMIPAHKTAQARPDRVIEPRRVDDEKAGGAAGMTMARGKMTRAASRPWMVPRAIFSRATAQAGSGARSRSSISRCSRDPAPGAGSRRTGPRKRITIASIPASRVVAVCVALPAAGCPIRRLT